MSETAATDTASSGFRRAHVIIVGNEKGGSGKTTTTMHLIVALLRLGFSVGSIDIDSRQRSLTRYFENRRQTVAKQGVSMPMPHHIVIQKSPFDSGEEAKADERERFAKGLARVYASCDFVIIDTPGNDTYMSRLAHSFANTIITPINDSFVDLDVLASVDGETLNIVKPSIYSEMVWEQKLQRAKRDGGAIDWIVMRNRLSNIDARNKRFMTKVTEELARRIGFRVAPGFSERVIFREMFLQGLTVLDVLETDNGGKLSISHVAARQEVRSLLSVLKIPEVDRRIEKLRTGEATEELKTAAETMARLQEEEAAAADEKLPSSIDAPHTAHSAPVSAPVSAPATMQAPSLQPSPIQASPMQTAMPLANAVSVAPPSPAPVSVPITPIPAVTREPAKQSPLSAVSPVTKTLVSVEPSSQNAVAHPPAFTHSPSLQVSIAPVATNTSSTSATPAMSVTVRPANAPLLSPVTEGASASATANPAMTPVPPATASTVNADPSGITARSSGPLLNRLLN
ncbi:MAG: AAA family ATPase [Rickettsiales bacterium]|nr:AAA family ATPase [Rickettsiales bacterium]